MSRNQQKLDQIRSRRFCKIHGHSDRDGQCRRCGARLEDKSGGSE